MTVKVGFQGNHGTFSEIAAMRYFEGQDYEQVPCTDFLSILSDVESGALDYALLPVENTTTGIIARTYDYFRTYDIHAIGEINVPIHHDLIVIPGTKIEEIREVYSHPEALSQCRNFFREHPWIQPVSDRDTAKSVEHVKEMNDPSKAALASSRAAEYYGMESLLTAVQDSSTNVTRFLCISKEETVSADADKISMSIILPHTPGALYNILGILARRGINILKLESRPIQGKMFEYLFFIDFEGNTKQREVKEVLHELQLRCAEAHLIGCYKHAERPDVTEENI